MFKRKTYIILILILVISVISVSCSPVSEVISTPSATWETPDENADSNETSYSGEVQINTSDPSVFEPEYDYDSQDINQELAEEAAGNAVLKGSSINFTGTGAETSGSVITIYQSGTYTFTGTLDDGRIVVNLIDGGDVYLIFNGVNITATDGPAVYIVNASDTVINIAKGTVNYLSDGTDYTTVLIADDEPNAVIYSKDDLLINGSGSLVIKANYKHGINVKDDLIIDGITLDVTSVSDSIRGKDSVVILSGDYDIHAGTDGIQSSNDEDEGKGFIIIENGTIGIECGNDGIQAATELIILNGDIKVIAGGGTQNIVVDANMNEQLKDSMPVVEETESTKGLKAVSLLFINGGTLNIDSHDDALHSDNIIEISGGVMILSTDDDGIHGDNEITINGGYIDISNCNEGIEAKIITVNDGEIYINASDDGFNASDGTAGSMGMMMKPGNETAAIGIGLYINGGYIVIRSNADSVDSNADFIMTGGTIIAQGPESFTNGALDANGEIYIDGGLLVAVGSSGMAEYPGPNSDQISFLYVYDTVQQPGTTIALESEDGEIVLAYTPDKVYQTLVFSSADLEVGKTYTIFSGGNAEGESTDGFYSSGSYSGGTLVAEITLQSTVTVFGTQSRMDGPGNGGTRPGRRP